MPAFLAPLVVWGGRAMTLISGLWIGEKLTGIGNKGNENNPLPSTTKIIPMVLLAIGAVALWKMIKKK